MAKSTTLQRRKPSAVAGPSKAGSSLKRGRVALAEEEESGDEEELEDSEGGPASGSDEDGQSDEDDSGGASDEDEASADQEISKQLEMTTAPGKTDANGDSDVTFADIGVSPELCESCAALGFKKPTKIQIGAIPPALKGRDIIGLAETGSGKTAAFSLPILQTLWENPQAFYALILAPTRELAMQISEQICALGAAIGVRTAVLVGGMDMMSQSLALGRKPHIVVATPGRLMDHLENTKGFSLRGLKYLVLDEADRMMDQDFGPILDKILKVIPKERNTYLFSATLSTKIEKLQRASLRNPEKVAVSSKNTMVETLRQYYIFLPLIQKDAYLVSLVSELSSSAMIVFTRTVHDAHRLSIMLRRLGFPAIPLHGQMSQSLRLASLNKFKSGGRTVLVATDVASRGLDISTVELVINYDMPTNSADYKHRVGRTARGGRTGRSITLVTQYDLEILQRLETFMNKKMEAYEMDKKAVGLLSDSVARANREAALEMRENGTGGGGGKRGRDHGSRGRGADDDRDRDDDVVQAGGPPSRGKKNKFAKSTKKPRRG